jgi:trigger factor
MKYKVKKVSDFENNIEINIDFEDLETKKDEAISKISKSLKVKGFRPGKIPKNIVIREVGEDYILEESIDLYLPEQIFEILQKEELNPAVRPVVKDLKKEKKSYKVNVLITLWPKLSKLPKLNQTVEVESITPTEEEILDQIERIKLQFADVNKVERPSKTSDYLLVNISGMENGKELEEFSYQDYLYELGSNSLTPSMDSKLEGVSTGAIIKFNDDIPSVGKSNVKITVLVKEIKEKVMPELTDEWVSSMTEFDNIAEMNDELFKNIEMVKKRQIANQYQGLLTSKLIEESKLELPEQLVIAEMDSILQNFMAELNQNNIKIEDYLQMTGLTEETLQEDLKNQATRNLSMVVILDKVVEDQELKLDDKEIKYIDDHMSTHYEEGNEVEDASHRLNLEAESLRNKAMLHILQQGVSVDKQGEKVYLQDVYNQDEEVREEE